jgi:hypothetical protein
MAYGGRLIYQNLSNTVGMSVVSCMLSVVTKAVRIEILTRSG